MSLSAFNIDNIKRVNSILTETLTKMASNTQNSIEDLYVNFKDIFIAPAISRTCIHTRQKKLDQLTFSINGKQIENVKFSSFLA